MPAHPNLPTPLQQLEAHLSAQAILDSRRGSFDMDDAPDEAVLRPFPRLHEALAWLEAQLGQSWRDADASAMKHQKTHERLARTAIAGGTGAIILAVVQLALKQTWPGLTGIGAGMEAIAVLAGLVSVTVGLFAKFDRNWLGQRHRAERLRMLKFQALARPELWGQDLAPWQAWVRGKFAALEGGETIKRIRQWSTSDYAEADEPPVPTAAPAADSIRALATYYQHKRVGFQAAYFAGKGDAAGRQVAPLRHLSLPLFYASVVSVIFHFSAEFSAGRLAHQGKADAARFWELLGLWGMALAAALPIFGVGVRAWFAAFELSRKATSFAARHDAMDQATTFLRRDAGQWEPTLRHMARDELFLEGEHREWLRLLLDAEWFL